MTTTRVLFFFLCYLLCLVAAHESSRSRSNSTGGSGVTGGTVMPDMPVGSGDSSRSRSNSSGNGQPEVIEGSGSDTDNSTGSGLPDTTGRSRSDNGDSSRSSNSSGNGQPEVIEGSGSDTDNSTGSGLPDTTGGSRSDKGDSSRSSNSSGNGQPEVIEGSGSDTDNSTGSGLPDTTGGSRSDKGDSSRSRSNSTESSITDMAGQGSGAETTVSTQTDMIEKSGRSGSRSDSSRTNRTSTDTRDNSTQPGSRCPTVSELLSEGCVLSCVVEEDDGCPACNETCRDITSIASPTSESSCSCTVDQVCLRVGRFGEPTCVDLLTEGERCDVRTTDIDDKDDKDETSRSKSEKESSQLDETSGSSAQTRVGGARDRYVFGNLGNATIGCQDGLVCTPVSSNRSECLPENPNGPCAIANQRGMQYECAPDGSFEPLQCRSDVEGLLRCFCVNPNSGETIADTETVVTTRSDAPDCARLFGCEVRRGGQVFNIGHGDYFVNVDTCQRCLCRNGRPTMCEPSVCIALQQSPPECHYEDESYSHGESFEVDCNLCGCSNGNITCTHQQCEDDEADVSDSCGECMNGPADHVCGINGITYMSACAAVYCGGLAPSDFYQGNCQSVDVCALHPCEEGERCFRKGGAACFDADGCDPNDLRLCVDPNLLMCNTDDDDDDDDDDEDTTVCGTNGITYPSLCRLLQDTGNEAVAYAGECDRDECAGGPVCGTDRVTYENVCVLRSQSANARVDFYGECGDRPGETLDDFCERVNEEGRCIYNTSNCDRLVMPEEGCCPLCGGIIFVAVDFAGLQEYISIIPTAKTLDDFIEILVDSGFVSDEITDRCELEATLTTTRNVQITLSSEEDSAFCNKAGERLAAAINDPSSVSGDPLSVQIPEVLQFASAAVTASYQQPSAIVDNKAGNNGSVNAASVLKRLPYVAIVLLAITTQFM